MLPRPSCPFRRAYSSSSQWRLLPRHSRCFSPIVLHGLYYAACGSPVRIRIRPRGCTLVYDVTTYFPPGAPECKTSGLHKYQPGLVILFFHFLSTSITYPQSRNLLQWALVSITMSVVATQVRLFFTSTNRASLIHFNSRIHLDLGLLCHRSTPKVTYPNRVPADFLSQMSLAAWLVGRFNSHHNYNSNTERDRVRYMLFVSLWTLILTPIYAVMFWRASKSAFSSIASHLVLCVPPLSFPWPHH